jgi:putative Mg2+ transporter-C (MgtC) family protein
MSSDAMLGWLASQEAVDVVIHLMVALVAGGLIGLERSYHGRPAGFRTHTLVCMASSLLMLVALYQSAWLPHATPDTVRIDPTRMAQGVMTGIGFLGAGVIMKEGLSVRGLTTAASIWITAAIGVLAGVGFYGPVVITTVLTLGTLTVFRRVESSMPTLAYAHFHVRFPRGATMSEPALRAMLADRGFTVANLSYRLVEDRQLQFFEYRMTIRTSATGNTGALAQHLNGLAGVSEFRIAPTGD